MIEAIAAIFVLLFLGGIMVLLFAAGLVTGVSLWRIAKKDATDDISTFMEPVVIEPTDEHDDADWWKKN